MFSVLRRFFRVPTTYVLVEKLEKSQLHTLIWGACAQLIGLITLLSKNAASLAHWSNTHKFVNKIPV